MSRKAKWGICVLVPGDQCQRASTEMREWGFPRVRQPVVLAWCRHCLVRARKNYLQLSQSPSRIGKYWCFPGREGGCYLGHRVVLFETLPSCGWSKSWTECPQQDQDFFPPPVHTLTWSACGVIGSQKKFKQLIPGQWSGKDSLEQFSHTPFWTALSTHQLHLSFYTHFASFH